MIFNFGSAAKSPRPGFTSLAAGEDGCLGITPEVPLGNLGGCILIHFSGLRKSEHGNFRIGISDFLRPFGIHFDDFLLVISPCMDVLSFFGRKTSWHPSLLADILSFHDRVTCTDGWPLETLAPLPRFPEGLMPLEVEAPWSVHQQACCWYQEEKGWFFDIVCGKLPNTSKYTFNFL